MSVSQDHSSRAGLDVENEMDILDLILEEGSHIICNPSLALAAIFGPARGANKPEFKASAPRLWVDRLVVFDFVEMYSANKVMRFRITKRGREAAGQVRAPSKALNVVSDQGFDKGHVSEKLESFRYETPLQILARKCDKTGKKYLTSRMVAAGERLREDFEIGEIDQRVTQNWKENLEAMAKNLGDRSQGTLSQDEARARWSAAMIDLGAGLSDIAYRVVCMNEGLVTAEQMLGWSARSGKIVLRIALMRLEEFYEIPLEQTEHMFG